MSVLGVATGASGANTVDPIVAPALGSSATGDTPVVEAEPESSSSLGYLIPLLLVGFIIIVLIIIKIRSNIAEKKKEKEKLELKKELDEE